MKILMQIAKIVVGHDDRRNASFRFDAIISVHMNFPIKADHLGKQIWNMSHPRERFPFKIEWFLCSVATRQFFIAFWNNLGRFEYLVGPKQALLSWAAYVAPFWLIPHQVLT